MNDLTHIDANDNAIMVDVSDKDSTDRTATAKGSVFMEPATLKLIS
ncbi:MAG: cyclic pyranopterin monophosphate synthase MoaC, partial [Rhodospirillales bacterium]